MAVEAESFDVLVAQFAGGPQMSQRISVAAFAKLTGLDKDTLMQYERRGRAARDRGDGTAFALMPALGPDGKWPAPVIAFWWATRPYRDRLIVNPPAPPRIHEPRQPRRRTSMAELVDLVRMLLTFPVPPKNVTQVLAMLAERDVRVSWPRARAALLAARPVPVVRSARPDGLVTAGDLARAYGVDPGTITKNVQGGLLTPVIREPVDQPRGLQGRLLFDPAWVMHPEWPLRSPVDKPPRPRLMVPVMTLAAAQQRAASRAAS